MSDVQLTAEDMRLFEDFYQGRIAGAGGARDDAAELAIARDILQAVVNDGLTPTPDGDESYVRRQGALDWTDPATLQAAAQVSGKRKVRGAAATGGQGGAKDVLTGVAMLVVAIGVGLWFFLPTHRSPSGKGGGHKGSETPLPETPVAEEVGATPTPLPTLESELLADIVDASGVKTDLVVPRTLEIRGVSFVVQPVKIGAGDWPLPDDERAVSWVYGSVVNYVMGVQATPDNKQLLASLKSGDELLLRTSTGSAYRFAFAGAVRVAPQAAEVFRQTRPGLTLALLGEEGQASRVVIRAVYVPDSELSSPAGPAAQEIQAGQAVVIDAALRLTFLGATPSAPPGTPPGTVYLVVDYAVESVLESGASLASQGFMHQVVDANGLTYSSTEIEPAGGLSYPALPAQLEARRPVTTSAAYVVPEETLARGLAWRFTPAPGGTTLQANIAPYAGSLRPQVSVREAARLPDGSLSLSFDVRASDLRPAQVSAAEVEVQGGRLAAGNNFPWQVPAGTAADFRLSLAPEGQMLTVVLLGQGFEVQVE